MSLSNSVQKWRYRLFPDHIVGELLSKNWIDNAIPFLIMVLLVATLGALIPGFFTGSNIGILARQYGELALVVLGMTTVILVGGIDLSVGSNFALGNFLMLYFLNLANLPVGVAAVLVILICGSVGLVNGVLVGYLRLRAFLTTLVTLIIVRAIVDLLLLKYAQQMSMSFYSSPLWDAMGLGGVWIFPLSFLVVAVVAIVAHIAFSRSGPGWRLLAIGGSRRSAYNMGLPVRRIVCSAYVISGMLVGASGVLYAARLSGAGSDTGIGLEVSALTAAILGGNSLGGGRGSVAKVLMGTVTVLVPTNGVLRLGLNSGSPLGMAFDRDGNLLVCVGGMGLYMVRKADREVVLVTDETNRSLLSVVDDSRLRLADDLDIAPDGRIYFSEATVRYEMHDWPVDALESRGNGRIICHDPKTGKTSTVLRNLIFPNGV